MIVPALAVAATTLLDLRDASACGGCFVPADESTQVTGHRMAVSVSSTKTTLWDQIEYSGNPASFAWVLPIKGQVEIGLSSDVMFAFLGQQTLPTVYPPPVDCPPPPSCYNAYDGATTSTATGAGGGGAGGVEVISQETVGPYETVQLSSTDPAALQDWLTSHGYSVPNDIAPIVGAYVNEGFDFLALKLVPGQGVEAMRPVRITAPGAGLGLPLRMVAAGTGAVTPLTLWVLGEGRYEAANFPNVVLDPAEVVWNWNTYDSNLSELRASTLAATNGFGWLTEAAMPMSGSSFSSQMLAIAEQLPDQSGYGNGDFDAADSIAECQADLDALFGTLSDASLWVTRLHAELPRAALAKDLALGAATQKEVSPFIQATKAVGKYECPVYTCDDTGQEVNLGDLFGLGSAGQGEATDGSSSSCAIDASDAPSGTLALGALAAAAALVARRRRR